MSQHEIRFNVPECQLGNADVTFRIKRDGGAYGRLLISKGSIVWIPGNAKKGFELGWATFDEMMREHGRH
jgi:hypothetical protein